ncbi:DUF3153 domain-containing protein [Paenibacillus sp. SEL3]|uniref:DUF3153 domain-containing protein n=1 Tax=Paenibacillus polymyxa TaxID=1406 RepID=A0A8I1IX36_PAEPO|nr:MULTISPECIES: DUF3153 domain-containing protein [Paenibacillus]KAF6576629.1 DUF3153 domain-containing protein [Paenibacillus sp. EKM206P]KAF6591237.1 DUF3153 domain-containing protein [Paenibacillus sp. EKM205P]MBM0631920.1 DUF3153 domain-containing protein [Paenibacillus polymyxa]MBO3283712.1 DUF3153 domain-containing protein [Paenibacillus polymyxa]MBP1310132.1 putative nucleic acid-binding Zn ribbon protein [Paenibacillus sp. 1182]
MKPIGYSPYRNKRRQVRIRKILLIFMLVCCLLALTSCARGDIHVDVHLDQSVDMDATFSVNNQTLMMLDNPGVLDQLVKRIQSNNVDVQPLAEQGRKGYQIKGHYQGDWSTNKKNPSQGLHLPEGLEIKRAVSQHFFTTNIDLTMKLDLPRMLPEEAQGLSDKFKQMNVFARKLLERQLDLNFSLSLPIQPATHNADRVSEDGKTLYWNIAPLESNELKLSVNVPNVRHIMYVAVTSLILIVIAVILLIRRHRSKKET